MRAKYRHFKRQRQLPRKGPPPVPGRNWLEYTGEGGAIYEVVPREKIAEILNQLMLDPKTAYNSRDKLFDYTQRHYIGIHRSDVLAWLKNREDYQLHQRQAKRVVKNPIISTHPNERWQIDHLEIVINDTSENKQEVLARENSGYRYVFNIVDHFSKFAWSFPTKTKGLGEALTHLKTVVKQNGPPEILQGDNAFRATKGSDFARFAKKWGIDVRNSEPYHPQTNGAVERFNGTLKRKMAWVMTTYSTARWIDALPDIMHNYNNGRHSTTGKTPAEVYNAADNSAIASAARKGITRQADKMKQNLPKLEPLKKGDIVRRSTQQKLDKLKNKILTYSWSVTLYRVIESKAQFGQTLYKIEREDGKAVDRRYYRDELLKIDLKNLDKTNYAL